MFDFLKNLIEQKSGNSQLDSVNHSTKHIQIATCALFLEIANADDDFANEEKEYLFNAMKEMFELNSEEVKELIVLSNKQISKSVSLYEFTEIIKNSFSDEEKYQLIKNLWKLIYADGKLDAYESHFIRKINGNLFLSHEDLMSAKAEAKREI